MAVLIGLLLNNARLHSIEASLGTRIGDSESGLRALIGLIDHKIDRVESNLNIRIDRVETRLTAIEGDLRQFYRVLGVHDAEIANLKTERRA